MQVNEIKEFVVVIQQLQNEKIDFVLIGNRTVRTRGAEAGAKNFPIVYSTDADNVERLAAFLESIHAYVMGGTSMERPRSNAALLQKALYLNLDTVYGRIDMMRELPGVDDFESLRAKARLADIGGMDIPVISHDDVSLVRRKSSLPQSEKPLHKLLTLRKRIAEKVPS